jgi:thiol-disulfide isomerase/thioredoxin/outer membrane lipoprotein-sorting protein
MMNRVRSSWMFKGLMSIALIAGLTALTLFGQSTTRPAPAPSAAAASAAHVSASAQAVLDKIRDSYAKLTWLDLSGTLSVAFDGGGQQRNDHDEFTFAFRSPNKFRHDMKDQTTIVSNGQKVYTFITPKNAYLTDDAPKARADGLPGEVAALLMDQDPSLALLLAPSASDALIAGASDVSLGDQTTIDGISYSSLNVVQPDEDETVLVDPKTNLIHRVQHDLRRSMKRQGVPNVKVALVTVDYVPTASGPSQTPSQNVSFDWTPPADAKPLADAPAPPAAGDDPMAPVAAQLNGKPAPSFTLKGLDGKTVSLADLKGSVVVLDFWATWCPPCREGLPHIANVARQRAGDGVKVFAINLQEDASQVQAFLQQAGLSLPVLLDSDGSIAQKYLANAIPETVIIDKNGTVHNVVELSIAPDEEKALNDQIDAALKAK